MHTDTHAAIMQGRLDPITKLKSLVEHIGEYYHAHRRWEYVSIRNEKKKKNGNHIQNIKHA